MTDLFKIEPTLSPRLAWMQKHGVQTKCAAIVCEDGEHSWIAWTGDLQSAVDCGRCETGETEADAIANLAISRKWLLWNEEA